MLHKSIKFFIENKPIPVVLLLLLVGWGMLHAPFDWGIEIPFKNPVAVDAIPDIGENQQIVFTKWDGRSPQDIEDQITYPLTSTLLGVAGVKTIRSSSMFGVSSIYIIFEDDIEFYWSRSRILEKLSSLPVGLLPDEVQPTLGPDATGLGQIFWYTLEGRDKQGNVTGGWDLHELRSIQDYYVKPALSSTQGVSEVASVGGYVKEYQIDVDPELMRQYKVSLDHIIKAIKKSNQDIGAQTLEINQAEYLVRGLGYIKSIEDIENTVVTSTQYTSIRVKDLAKVVFGPQSRRGILDKEGAEVAGGVVVARYGANPMEVIENLKHKITDISTGLPSKTMADGSESQLTIVPFYDRTELIQETLATLKDALTLEILITVLVIVVMVFNLRASILISGLLPVSVLMVFIAMKIFDVEANIVALSGIAIAIGTMVDVGVILSENIIRHLEVNEKDSVAHNVYVATIEVSGAILTAVLTTIISFIPVFTMIGAEGKLFRPLAFTKTIALVASIVVALFLIPPFATFLFGKKNLKRSWTFVLYLVLLIIGIVAIIYGIWLGIVLILFGILFFLRKFRVQPFGNMPRAEGMISILAIICLLAQHWRPLGFDRSFLVNVFMVGGISFGLLLVFSFFKQYYTKILGWALHHKFIFLCIPLILVICGVFIMKNMGKEFMPSLNEGSFLLMPTSLPHAGVEENKRVLQQLDMAVANIPEVKTVVGKSGRVESALDPAPLSMFENVIQYRSEYEKNNQGKYQRYKTNENGYFVLSDNSVVANPNTAYNHHVAYPKDSLRAYEHLNRSLLIEDNNGEYFRNWRPKIKSSNDIWNEIVKATQLPGITSAPKLQPIETRLIMLQTGMRAPFGIKIKGEDVKQIENFGLQLENILRETKGIKTETIFAERIVGKPYLLIDIQREKLMRYGITVKAVQDIIKVALGGMPITKTVEGRERYAIRVRYPRELRSTPEDLKKIYVPVKNGVSIPLGNVVEIRYERGSQAIKSEDTFLTGYVLFDKVNDFAEVDVIQNAKQKVQEYIDNGALVVPKGITYKFAGTYEHQLRAEKTLSWVVPLVLLIILLILYFQFRSVTTSLMVFSGIAVAFAGGFIMIWLYGQEWFLDLNIFGENLRDVFQIHTINLSVAVWVGFIALFGIATDDGVVMATYLTQAFDRNNLPTNRDKIISLVVQAGEKRIRPCLMTTATTILALLPILTSTGRGSDIMIPMAIPAFGGMSIALITLFVVPVLFSWKQEIALKNRIQNKEKNHHVENESNKYEQSNDE